MKALNRENKIVCCRQKLFFTVLKSVSIILAFLIIVLFKNCYAQNEGDDVVIGKYRKMISTILEEEFIYLEHLPSNYDNSDRTYPVLFLMNAQMLTTFANASSTLDRLGFERIPQMILIGISNTGRASNYWPIRPRTGKPGEAEIFLKFLTDEFIPFINKKYKTEDYRILMGQSNTGLFTIYAMLENPASFNAYIVSSPMLGWCSDIINEKAVSQFSKGNMQNRFLYIEYGGFDYTSFVNDHIPAFAQILEQKAPKDFKWIVSQLDNEGHVPLSTLNNGLINLFTGFMVPEKTKEQGLDEVINYYTDLSKKYGFNVSPPEEVFFNMAIRMKQKQEYEESIRIFMSLLNRYPFSTRGNFYLGEVYSDKGDKISAMKYYKKVLEIDPDYQAAKLRLEEIN